MAAKSDFRSASRDHNRAVTQKAKWAYGVADSIIRPIAPGRADTHHPRPARPSDYSSSGSANYNRTHTSNKTIRKQGVREAVAFETSSLSSSPDSLSGISLNENDYEDTVRDVDFVVDNESSSFDYNSLFPDEPVTGQRLLNGALDRALQAFQDEETEGLVRREWSLLDDEGEEVGLAPSTSSHSRKSKRSGRGNQRKRVDLHTGKSTTDEVGNAGGGIFDIDELEYELI